MLQDPVSNSEITDFRRCRRMHSWKHGQHFGPMNPPSETSAAEIGSRFHAALERFYNGVDVRTVMDDVTNAKDFYVKRLLKDYFTWLVDTGADSSIIRVISSEEVVEGNINGVAVRGKLDLRVKDKDGELIIDFKTTGEHIRTKLRQLEVMDQAVFYSLLTGVPRFSYRVVRRVPLTEGDYQVAEHFTDIPKWRVLDLHRRMVDLLPELMHNRGVILADPSPDMDCTWRCPFVRACVSSNPVDTIQEYQTTDPNERYK